MSEPIIRRVWEMYPSGGETFRLNAAQEMLRRYVRQPAVDPFARDTHYATYANDLNPDTEAEFHLPADDFLDRLIGEGVEVQTAIFDPPYSARLTRELYQSVGLDREGDWTNSILIKRVKDRLDQLMMANGHAICFGWNSAGFGIERGYELLEVVMVAHGGSHSDTIITAEQKVARVHTPSVSEDDF